MQAWAKGELQTGGVANLQDKEGAVLEPLPSWMERSHGKLKLKQP